MAYDAATLNDPTTDIRTKLDILAFYGGCTNDRATIKEVYKTNLSIQALFRRVGDFTDPPPLSNKSGGPDKMGGEPESANLVQSFISNAGGIDITTFAVGATDFIIKRTKDELNVAFFSRFKRTLSQPNYIDLHTVFPSTWRTLDNVGEDIYNYTRYLTALQDAFRRDLSTITTNLPGILDNHPIFFQLHPKLGASLRSGLYFAEGWRDGMSPGLVLEQYDTNLISAIPEPTFKSAIKTVQLLSFALRDTAQSRGYWLEEKKIRETFSKPELRDVFFGLLFQYGKTRYRSLSFLRKGDEGNDVLTALNNLHTRPDNAARWTNFITSFSAKTEQVNRLVREYAQRKDSLSIEQLYTYFKNSQDLLRFAQKLNSLPELMGVKLDTAFLTYFDVADAASSLVTDINKGKYISAISDAAVIYRLVRNADHDNMAVLLQSRIDRSPSEVEDLRSQLQFENSVQEVSNILFRYGTFIAAVADADSSRQVTEAIEAFAMPSGSSRIKRETQYNVSLNAYAGLFAGYEKISGLASDDNFKLNATGLAIPIGIAISAGTRKFLGMPCAADAGHWSYSAFISVVDLGAVGAFRINNDGSPVEDIPTIQLKDIISPGIFLSIGIPKSPLSINLGAQMGPNLRRVTGTANDYSGEKYYRYTLSLLVDIPVLNLYTRSKD